MAAKPCETPAKWLRNGAKWCETYKNETIGGIGIVTDSWGMASLFLSNGNAQKLLNCKDNSKVIIKVSN